MTKNSDLFCLISISSTESEARFRLPRLRSILRRRQENMLGRCMRRGPCAGLGPREPPYDRHALLHSRFLVGSEKLEDEGEQFHRGT